MATEVASKQKVGKVVQVIGPVVDIEFADGHLPDIYNAVHIVSDGKGGSSKMDVVCEVEQHLGENRVRTVAMNCPAANVRMPCRWVEKTAAS